MDRPENKQKRRDAGTAGAGGGQEEGESTEDRGGSAETVDGGGSVGPRWSHDHDLNFENVRSFLNVMKEGMEKSIAECEDLVKKKRAELKKMGGR